MSRLIFHRGNSTASYEYEPGGTLLDILLSLDCDIENPCNGKGTCGKCLCEVSGQEFPISSAEKKFDLHGKRLACEIFPTEDIEVRLEEATSDGEFLNAMAIPNIEFKPYITKRDIKVNLPSLERRVSRREAYEECVGRLNYPILKNLPQSEENVCAVYGGDDLIGLESCGAYGNLAVAVDIGTTTVQLVLVDVEKGKIIASDSFLNPQKSFGLDVISRLSYARENGGQKLGSAIIAAVEASIYKLLSAIGRSVDELYEVVVSANSVMLHMFFSIDSTSLGSAPYAPAYSDELYVYASEIGLKLGKFTKVYSIPAVSAYVGGDVVSGALATDLSERKGNVLFIDIGTNGELILKTDSGMTATSCAAGPALEGMNISCGMRAAEGAIEDVRFDFESGVLVLDVIGNVKPIGICGSGLLGAISELVRGGIIDKNGRLIKLSDMSDDDVRRNFIVEHDGRVAVKLADNIYITKKDIRSVQLTKTAVMSGILALLEDASITAEELDCVLVAGQFGNHLTEEMLTGCAIVPMGAAGRIRYVGNSSMDGALCAIMNGEFRAKLGGLARRIDFLELSTLENYDRIFIRSSYFPERGVGNE